MKNIYKASFLFLFAAILCFSFGTAVLAQTAPQIQTNSATNIQNNSAVLNGNITNIGNYGSATVYFQWGISSSYSYQTPNITQNYTGIFSQTISNLAPNTTFHFRAVAQNNYGTVYGQDMTFNSSVYGNYGNGTLFVSEQVINLTAGNLNWQTSVNAKPSDILSFSVILQANGGQDIHNVIVTDILPSNLIYKGNMTVNANLNYSGNLASGINIGTIPAGGIEVIVFQAQVSSAENFGYGNTIIANNATVTSQEIASQNSSATVIVNRSLVYSASTISTGLTNNFFTDSFFLPLLLIIFAAWFYLSGKAMIFANKLKARTKR